MSLGRNLKWTSIAQITKILVKLISLTILTRMLEPEEYGLMAMAAVVTNFALIIRDLGVSAAIIQRKYVDDSLISTVFWLNIIIATIICLIILVIAPVASYVFSAVELESILTLLAFGMPIVAMSSIHMALLERESQFKTIAIVEITSSLIGLFTALIMAFNGFGVYSLVGQSLVTSFSSTCLYLMKCENRIKLTFSIVLLKDLVGFSGNLTAFNLINYFSRNIDSVVIGYYFTSKLLGAYSLAYRIMLFPLQSMSSISSRALFPLMSRSQDDINEIKDMYLKVNLMIASVSAPIMFGLLVIREPFVNIVFGSQWSEVPELLFWMAPIGFLQSITSTAGSVFLARARTDILMRLGLLTSILFGLAFMVGSQFNITYVMMLYFLSNIIVFMLTMFYVTKLVSSSLYNLLNIIRAPLLSAFAMCFCLNFFYIAYFPINSWLSLSCCILFGAGIYILSYRVIFSDEMKEIIPRRLIRFLGY